MIVFASAGPGPSRPRPLQELYQEFATLSKKTNGPYYLENYTTEWNWPRRGIYIFFTPDSNLKSDPHPQWTVARIGTVGVAKGSTNTLRNRMRQHRGNEGGKYGDGGGNHRGSVFRLHVGRALIEKDELHDEYPYWGTPNRNIPDDVPIEEVRQNEHDLEQRVSDYIRSLPFLILNVPGDSGPKSDRARIEKQLLGTFGFYHRTQDYLRDENWLGTFSPKPEIYKTGLWNIDHVDGFSSPTVVYDVEEYIEQTEPLETVDSNVDTDTDCNNENENE